MSWAPAPLPCLHSGPASAGSPSSAAPSSWSPRCVPSSRRAWSRCFSPSSATTPNSPSGRPSASSPGRRVRVLVTGGCGFLGSHFVKRLAAAGDEAVVLDRLTDFGNLANLEGVAHEFVQGDVADAVTATGAADGCAAIVNFAAETNLDVSGLASGGFIVTDVFGTHVLLEFARVAGIRYVQVSTSEAFSEPTAPAASRAGADLQVLAYVETYGL